MKKLVTITLLVLLTGCSNVKKHVSNSLDLNLDKCTVKNIITHHEFHGDGEYFASISCEEELELSKNWKKLPLTDNIREAAEMEICDDDNCGTIFKKYNIPKLEEGYYYFEDRHPDSKDKYDDKDLNNRSSYNYTLAFYDQNNKKIYFFEFDT